jgi:hypothetical protein
MSSYWEQWESVIGSVETGDMIRVEWSEGYTPTEHVGEITTMLPRDRSRSRPAATAELPKRPKGWDAAHIVIDGHVWIRPTAPPYVDVDSIIVVSVGDGKGHNYQHEIDSIETQTPR